MEATHPSQDARTGKAFSFVFQDIDILFFHFSDEFLFTASDRWSINERRELFSMHISLLRQADWTSFNLFDQILLQDKRFSSSSDRSPHQSITSIGIGGDGFGKDPNDKPTLDTKRKKGMQFFSSIEGPDGSWEGELPALGEIQRNSGKSEKRVCTPCPFLLQRRSEPIDGEGDGEEERTDWSVRSRRRRRFDRSTSLH